MKVIHIMANNSSVPYFNWFAEEVKRYPEIEFIFIAMHSSKPQMLEDMKQRGCVCHWIPFDYSKRKSDMILACFRLFRLFFKLKPDVVHTHLFDDSLPGLIAARLAGVKKRVITKQDTTFHWNYAPQWVWADKFNNWNATHIHAVASENKKFILENEKADARKVFLVRNGFPFELMTNSTPEQERQLKDKYNLENRFVIGTVARLIEWKGHKLILEAAKALVEKYPKILFLWAGSGDKEYMEELDKIIGDYGLANHVLMTGQLSRVLMPAFYKNLKIYLHPALNEPFGFAISEALMNGVPVIATRTGSTDLIEHMVEGYILKAGSSDDIAQALENFLSHENEIMEMAHKGRDHAIKYLQFKRMMDEHIDMYKSTVN